MAKQRAYILLYESFLDWEWADEPIMVALFVRLLLLANYLPNHRYRGKEQPVGAVLTSRKELARALGLHPHTVMSRLRKLEKSGEIKIKTSGNGLQIDIVKYAEYQYIPQGNITPVITPVVTDDITPTITQGENGENVQAGNAGVIKGIIRDVTPTITPKQQKSASQLTEKQDSYETGVTTDVTPPINYPNSLLNNNTNKGIINKKNKAKKADAHCADFTPQTTAQLEAMFDEFRKAYGGTKRGLKAELDNFKKKNDNWREIVPLLMPALEREKAYREQAQAAGQFVPNWAYLQTWINQRRWETEFEAVQASQPASTNTKQQPQQAQQPPKDDDYGGSFGGLD